MIILRQLLIVPFLFIGILKKQQFVKINQDASNRNVGTRHNSTNKNQLQKTMGISINLFRVNKAEKLNDLKDLENQISKTTDTRVNLYKITSDLAVIFLNTTDPYSNSNTIPYKMLFGRHAEQCLSSSN